MTRSGYAGRATTLAVLVTFGASLIVLGALSVACELRGRAGGAWVVAIGRGAARAV